MDKDTEGLLLITNDGELAHRLLSPKKHVDKTYYAKVQGIVTQEDVRKFAEGVDIHEKKLNCSCSVGGSKVGRSFRDSSDDLRREVSSGEADV